MDVLAAPEILVETRGIFGIIVVFGFCSSFSACIILNLGVLRFSRNEEHRAAGDNIQYIPAFINHFTELFRLGPFRGIVGSSNHFAFVPVERGALQASAKVIVLRIEVLNRISEAISIPESDNNHSTIRRGVSHCLVDIVAYLLWKDTMSIIYREHNLKAVLHIFRIIIVQNVLEFATIAESKICVWNCLARGLNEIRVEIHANEPLKEARVFLEHDLQKLSRTCSNLDANDWLSTTVYNSMASDKIRVGDLVAIEKRCIFVHSLVPVRR
mmetsp:Transcript_15408/g.29053  ORF Transcript_15408/g.29053 Transcript_15408/m.29053 type:complete len:270 (-) Transcript_15408:93-902(-)